MSEERQPETRVRTEVEGWWPSGAPVVLAASGGGDSTALVALLCEAGVVEAERAVVAHFDHRLRGADEAARERACVDALCGRYGLSIAAGNWDAPRPGEAAARAARYTFLRDVAARAGAVAVVTGHTSDDQVETVLMHSLRGAGLHGLAGMAPDGAWPFGRGPRLLRPLLCVSRTETRAYCDWRALAYADDPGNDARTFLRNRLRHELLPRLEAMAPGARSALLGLARDAREGLAALESVAADAVLDDEAHDGMVCLSRDALRAMPPALAPYAFRLALVRLVGDARDIERRHYDVLTRVALARTGSRYVLPRGVVVTVDADAVIVSDGALRTPAIDADLAVPLPFAGVVGAWSLSIERAARAVGDVVRLPEGAVVRARRPGDRLLPAGMRGHKKLQDYYVDRKVPRRERDAAPLIARGSDVWWTPYGGVRDCADGATYSVRCERTP